MPQCNYCLQPQEEENVAVFQNADGTETVVCRGCWVSTSNPALSGQGSVSITRAHGAEGAALKKELKRKIETRAKLAYVNMGGNPDRFAGEFKHEGAKIMTWVAIALECMGLLPPTNDRVPPL